MQSQKRNVHPNKKEMPPMGVTAPKIGKFNKTSKYSEPEKITDPIAKQSEALFLFVK